MLFCLLVIENIQNKSAVSKSHRRKIYSLALKAADHGRKERAEEVLRKTSAQNKDYCFS